jgi:hypothetical protein
MKIRGARIAWRAALLGGALTAIGCGRAAEAPGAPGSDERPAERAAGEPLLKFPAEALVRAGVETAAVTPSRRDPEIEAFGRVVDPAALIAAIADREATRAASDAAQREQGRLEALARGEQNASAREVEAARAAVARASADFSSADARLVALLGIPSRARPDLASLGQQLAQRESALVRIDVPAGEQRPEPERGARLAAYPNSDTALEARYLGPATDSDPALPGWGFLFLVTRDPPPGGAPVHAWLRAPGPSLSGVSVPAASLVHHAGGMFVFVERGPGAFERRAVTAEPMPDGAWFVSAGLAEGARIAVSGAQALLSAGQLAAGAGGGASD